MSSISRAILNTAATAASVALLSIVCVQAGSAQIALSTSTAYTQNFDGIGITATATLPASFKVDKPAVVRTVGTYAAAATATALLGGANLSSTASNGIYNFGAGTTTTGPERAVGFLSSGTATSSGNLYAQFVNNTGAGLTGLQISYNVEKYRAGINAAGFRIQLFYSTDGSAWTTAGANFLTSFAQDPGSVNSGYTPAPGATSPVTNQTLTVSIPNGSNFYLAWNYSVSTGAVTTNGQALAVDDISILGVAGAPVQTNPSATGSASPNPVTVGSSTTLSAVVTAGANPTSTSLTATCDLTTIGGSSTFSLPSPGFSALYTVPGGTIPQLYTLPCIVSDAQSRSGNFNIALTVSNASTSPTGSGSANPNSLQAGASTLLTVNVTPGTNPASTGLAVTADLSSIGGSVSQQLSDNGGNSFSFNATVASNTTPGSKSLPATITDAQSRTGSATISLSVQFPPAPHSVKISQVYGGGGNSGATFKNDFIELYNQSASPVDVSLWSVQETSAAATGAWQVTPLCPVNGTCILSPGHYYLVQEGQGAGGTTNLPAPDATGAIALSATDAKVALVNNTTALSGACPTGSNIADMVGYGSATCSETAATTGLSNTTAAVRKGNGCIDTDNNSNDFDTVGPIPRDSGAPAHTCAALSPLSGVGIATPDSVDPVNSPAETLLTVAVIPAPDSTGITVTGDLTNIGGSASQPFYDDGTHGDATAGDRVFSLLTNMAPATPLGARFLVTTVADAQSRTASVPITVSGQSPTCGTERWAVKVGTDAGAANVDLANPVRTTIKALRAIPAPVLDQNPPYDPRFVPTETTVFVVNGTLTFYKLEDDVDYHIVFQDPVGNTMVTEIPAPACDGSTSPFDAAIRAVRAKFNTHFTPLSSFQNANVPVQIKGVGFFDLLHGQTGLAPNGIELHPILDISFTTPSTLTLSASANPSVFGEPVTITATASIPSGTPTGDVSFFEGSTLLGTGTLDSNGHATLTNSTLPAGPHSITATYDGDSQASQSSSTPLALNISQATPVITWATPAAITFGSALGAGQLNATTTIPGTFVYTPSTGAVPAVGAQTLSVVFTPTSSNYIAAAKSVTINVLPASGGGSPANLVLTQTLSRVGGQVVATLTVANTGGTAAPNVALTAAKIGTVSGTPLPQSLGTIAAGASVHVTVTFPGTVGAPGAGSSLTLSGTYTGGTFGSTLRITLP